MSKPLIVPPVALFQRMPSDWVAQQGCECVAAGVGVVNGVVKAPVVYAAGAGGALPGLTADETALLAAILTALALFLLLLLPILCCLLPLCGWCGAGKKKKNENRRANMIGSENESFWSTGTFGKAQQYDQPDTIRLPRPYVEHPPMVRAVDDDGGWEGIDVSRDELEAPVQKELASKSADVYESNQLSRRPSTNTMGYGTLGRNTMGRRDSGDDVITEVTTTRRMDMTIGGLSQDGAEQYYTKTYGQSGEPEMSKDNFMKIYYSYKNDLDRGSQGGYQTGNQGVYQAGNPAIYQGGNQSGYQTSYQAGYM